MLKLSLFMVVILFTVIILAGIVILFVTSFTLKLPVILILSFLPSTFVIINFDVGYFFTSKKSSLL